MKKPLNEEGSPLFVVPDAIEPVVGWKSWVLSRNGYLISPNFPYWWEPNAAAQAKCDHPGDEKYDIPPHTAAPNEKCNCGFYIARDAVTAFAYGYILGEIYGWGKVIQHELGWRVEYAYPKIFYVDIEPYKSFLREFDVPIMVMPPSEVGRLVLDDKNKSKIDYENLSRGFLLRNMQRRRYET